MRMLFHTAPFGADNDALALKVGDGLNRRVSQLNEKHRTGIGRSYHSQRNFFRKGRSRIFRPADPVGSHESELKLTPIQLLRIMDARVGGLHDALVIFIAPTVKQFCKRRTLSIKGSAVLRRSNSYRHQFASSDSLLDKFPLCPLLLAPRPCSSMLTSFSRTNS